MTIQPVPGVSHAPPSERRFRQTPIDAFEQTFARIETHHGKLTKRREAPAAEDAPRQDRESRSINESSADRPKRASSDDVDSSNPSPSDAKAAADTRPSAESTEPDQADVDATQHEEETSDSAAAPDDGGDAQPVVTATNPAIVATSGSAEAQTDDAGLSAAAKPAAAPVVLPANAARQGAEPTIEPVQQHTVVSAQAQGDNAQTSTGDDAASQQPGTQARAQSQATASAPSASSASSTGTFSSAPTVAPQNLPTSAAPAPAPPPAANPAGAQNALPDFDSAGTDANVARVTRALNNSVNQNGGSLTLRMTPAELGTVRIELRIAGGTVQANLHAESASVRDLLQQQISQLRTALEARGLSVERLDVQTMQNNHSSSAFEHDQQADHSAGDGRSRGRFDSQQARQQQAAQAQDGAAFDELVAQAQA